MLKLVRAYKKLNPLNYSHNSNWPQSVVLIYGPKYLELMIRKTAQSLVQLVIFRHIIIIDFPCVQDLVFSRNNDTTDWG